MPLGLNLAIARIASGVQSMWNDTPCGISINIPSGSSKVNRRVLDVGVRWSEDLAVVSMTFPRKDI